MRELAEKSGVPCSEASIVLRLSKAKAWLNTYNPEEIIALRETPNAAYGGNLDDKRRAQIAKLREILKGDVTSIAALDEMLYGIPKEPSLNDKELKVAQRGFFKDVYNLLIGKDAGPRLSTFLWAIDRETVLKLLG
jgi:lysyl-tRNA synthetase class 1